jgi:hypothetical protein
MMLGLLLTPALARGDGGVVRASASAEPYRMTVFTSPTPLRAGVIDLSVLVQDTTGKPVPDARVLLHVRPAEAGEGGTTHEATREAATNKLYQAAPVELRAGSWEVVVDVSGEKGTGSLQFDMEVGEALPAWTEMAFWIALPLVPIILFVMVQTSLRRSRGVNSPGPSAQPPAPSERTA